MNNYYYCPICGFELEYAFTLGVICDCCGNEYGCDDIDFIKDTVDRDKYEFYVLMAAELHMKNQVIPKKISEFLSNAKLSEEEIWERLRENWIRDGCNFKWYHKNKKIVNWNIKRAQKQLLNINIDLNNI
ncbi:hypothetical protein DP145_13005 [Clostridium tetani]|uniref:hypothetical protein n=1 Tax=Clostridium tetani TaxID=1513 RepID=UPI00100BF2DC|nr:hypothetical protein [Clostridium tetani]RXI44001.1 hypothetical protein DP126_12370 [Clostridium tetani]RXM59554.1 hypothetical protein DP138_12645 [Clostridium tetani]RXM63717.1 hypothetical protein DP145_13005 [Clostridium tetani]